MTGSVTSVAVIAVSSAPSSPAASATSSSRSITSIGWSSLPPCSVSGRSDHTQALTSVSTPSPVARSTRRRLISAVRSGRSMRQAGAGAGAVRPLRHVVDVLEGDARDRPQHLARRLVDALALVEPAGVVVGDGPLDRMGQRQPPLPDQLGEQLDEQHDLEVVLVAEVARVVLGEGDVVVRVEHDDPAGADRPPVVDVVPGELARPLDVPHLRGRTAAAPLLAHQSELDTRRLEDPGGGARHRRAVERPFAVAEEDRLAADRDVEAGGPVADVVLADRHLAEHRLGPLRGRSPRPTAASAAGGCRSRRRARAWP